MCVHLCTYVWISYADILTLKEILEEICALEEETSVGMPGTGTDIRGTDRPGDHSDHREGKVKSSGGGRY